MSSKSLGHAAPEVEDSMMHQRCQERVYQHLKNAVDVYSDVVDDTWTAWHGDASDTSSGTLAALCNAAKPSERGRSESRLIVCTHREQNPWTHL